MAANYPDIVPHLEKWVAANRDIFIKQYLWSKPDYTHWVRYQFWLALHKTLKNVNIETDVSLGKGGNDPTAHILLSNSSKDSRSLVVRFVCEGVYGNAGNFETFVQAANAEFQKFSKPESRNGYEDVGKLMIIGLSEPPSEPTGEGYPRDTGAFIVEPAVQFNEEELHCWILEAEFPPLED